MADERCGSVRSSVVVTRERRDLPEPVIRQGELIGLFPGGGVSLLACISGLEKLRLDGDEKVGAMIIRRALEAPLRQIAKNAGQDGAVVAQNVRAKNEQNYGYNAATEKYEDLLLWYPQSRYSVASLAAIPTTGGSAIPCGFVFPAARLNIASATWLPDVRVAEPLYW